MAIVIKGKVKYKLRITSKVVNKSSKFELKKDHVLFDNRMYSLSGEEVQTPWFGDKEKELISADAQRRKQYGFAPYVSPPVPKYDGKTFQLYDTLPSGMRVRKSDYAAEFNNKGMVEVSNLSILDEHDRPVSVNTYSLEGEPITFGGSKKGYTVDRQDKYIRPLGIQYKYDEFNLPAIIAAHYEALGKKRKAASILFNDANNQAQRLEIVKAIDPALHKTVLEIRNFPSYKDARYISPQADLLGCLSEVQKDDTGKVNYYAQEQITAKSKPLEYYTSKEFKTKLNNEISITDYYYTATDKLGQQGEHLDIGDFTFKELEQFKTKKLEKGILTYRSLKDIGWMDGEVVPSTSEMKALITSKAGTAAVELLKFDAINAIKYMSETPSKTRHNFTFPTIEHDGLKISLMEPGNPKQLIMGHITSCCQSIDWAGSDCAQNSWTKEDFGTVVIEKEGRIIAQSYVWTTPKAFIFDNVEINKQYQYQSANHVDNYTGKDINREINTSIKESIELATRRLEKTYNHVVMGLDYNKVTGWTKDYQEVDATLKELGVSKLQYDSYSDAIDGKEWNAVRLDNQSRKVPDVDMSIPKYNQLNKTTTGVSVKDIENMLPYAIQWQNPIAAISDVILIAAKRQFTITDPSIVAFIKEHKNQVTVSNIEAYVKSNFSIEDAAYMKNDIAQLLKPILG